MHLNQNWDSISLNETPLHAFDPSCAGPVPLVHKCLDWKSRGQTKLNNTVNTVRPFNILSFLTTSERPQGGLPFTLVIYIQYMELRMQLLSILPLFHFYASCPSWNGAWLWHHKNACILRKSPLFAVTTGCVFVKHNDNTGKSKRLMTVRMNRCTDFTTNNDKRAYNWNKYLNTLVPS